MGEPDHALGIDDGVVRLDLLARQIILRTTRGSPARSDAAKVLSGLASTVSSVLRLTEAR